MPIKDMPPPREIPLEERILRERKEKQIANQLQIQHEKQQRIERQKEAKKNSMFANRDDMKNKKITYDHNGKVIFVKTVKANKYVIITSSLRPQFSIKYRLLNTVEPGIELAKEKRKKSKKAKKPVYKGINASLIIDNAEKSERDFMGTLNGYAPEPQDCVVVQPRVNLNTKNRFLRGPDPEKGARMTLDDYYVISQNNRKLRYDKTGSQSKENSQINLKSMYLNVILS